MNSSSEQQNDGQIYKTYKIKYIMKQVTTNNYIKATLQ